MSGGKQVLSGQRERSSIQVRQPIDVRVPNEQRAQTTTNDVRLELSEQLVRLSSIRGVGGNELHELVEQRWVSRQF